MDPQATLVEIIQRVSNLELNIHRIRTRLQIAQTKSEDQKDLYILLSSSVTINFLSILNDRDIQKCDRCYLQDASLFLKLYSPVMDRAIRLNL